MKKLILLRHAKSSWSDPDLDDHDRPLNGRGRSAAPVIAEWLRTQGHLPDRIVCSTAVRARETLERMREIVKLPKEVLEPALYHAEPATMLEILHAQPKKAKAVMFIGHQPGLSAFARMLAGGKIRPGCSRAFEHYPTAAAAVLLADLKAWDAIGPHSARFAEFAKPRELADSQAVGNGGAQPQA